MSQYAEGGVMGSKPYVATGNYTQRMRNPRMALQVKTWRASLPSKSGR